MKHRKCRGISKEGVRLGMKRVKNGLHGGG